MIRIFNNWISLARFGSQYSQQPVAGAKFTFMEIGQEAASFSSSQASEHDSKDLVTETSAVNTELSKVSLPG